LAKLKQDFSQKERQSLIESYQNKSKQEFEQFKQLSEYQSTNFKEIVRVQNVEFENLKKHITSLKPDDTQIQQLIADFNDKYVNLQSTIDKISEKPIPQYQLEAQTNLIINTLYSNLTEQNKTLFDTLTQKLNQSISNTNSINQQQVKDLSDRFSTFQEQYQLNSQTYTTNIEELKTLIETNKQLLTSDQQKNYDELLLQIKNTQRQTQDDKTKIELQIRSQLNSNQQKFTSLEKNLINSNKLQKLITDKKLSEQQAQQLKQLFQLHKEYSAKLHKQQFAFYKIISENDKNINTKLNNFISDTKLDLTKKQIQDLKNLIQQSIKFNIKFAKLEEKLTAFDEKLKKIDEKNTQKISKTETEISKIFEEMTSLKNGYKTDFQEFKTDFEQKHKELLEKNTNDLEINLENLFTQKLDLFKTYVNQQLLDLGNNNKLIIDTLNENLTSFDEKTKSEIQQLKSTITGFNEINNNNKQEINSLHKDFNMLKEFISKIPELQSTLESTLPQINKKIEEQNKQLQEQVVSTETLTQKQSSDIDTLTKAISHLKTELDQKNKDQDEKFNEKFKNLDKIYAEITSLQGPISV
jgi:hypothetical protein